MPVILNPKDEATWLDPAIEDLARLPPLVGPYPADLMAAEQVNPALNKPSFEGPVCLLVTESIA
jgi:putative SOS response-associated peptidase YedK